MTARTKKVLLLTACVNPNGMAFTLLQDCEERYNQYKDSLEFYLKHTKESIVFVENSSYDLTGMEVLFEDYIKEGRLELMSFSGNNYDRSLGKGYGEALILEHALKNSYLLRECDILIKITGRLKCLNIQTILFFLKKKNRVTANLVYDQWGNLECHSHFFSAPPVFFADYFLNNKALLNDSKNYWFEHLLFDSIKEWKREGRSFGEFLILPLIEGKSGSVAVQYNLGIKDMIIHFLRCVKHVTLLKSL